MDHNFPCDDDPAAQPIPVTYDAQTTAIERALDQLSHLDRAIREQAARTLVTHGAAAVPLVLDYLRDPFNQGRALAAQVLGRIGDVGALPGLLAAMNEPDELIRANAVAALAAIGHADAIPALQAALNDNNPRIRETAHRGLAQLNAMPEATTTDIDPRLLNQHATALRSRAAAARQAAMHTLIEIGAPAVPVLLDALTVPEAFARKVAVDALREIDDPRARTALETLAESDPDAQVRQAARLALAMHVRGPGDNA
jgi:HEAT repeat protein